MIEMREAIRRTLKPSSRSFMWELSVSLPNYHHRKFHRVCDVKKDQRKIFESINWKLILTVYYTSLTMILLACVWVQKWTNVYNYQRTVKIPVGNSPIYVLYSYSIYTKIPLSSRAQKIIHPIRLFGIRICILKHAYLRPNWRITCTLCVDQLLSRW